MRFTVGDARALAQPDGAFDCVLASRLLMVVPEREAVLAEARRVLAPGGILLIAEPVPAAWERARTTTRRGPAIGRGGAIHRAVPGALFHGGVVPGVDRQSAVGIGGDLGGKRIPVRALPRDDVWRWLRMKGHDNEDGND